MEEVGGSDGRKSMDPVRLCEFFEGSEYTSGRGSMTCGFECFLRTTDFRCFFREMWTRISGIEECPCVS